MLQDFEEFGSLGKPLGFGFPLISFLFFGIPFIFMDLDTLGTDVCVCRGCQACQDFGVLGVRKLCLHEESYRNIKIFDFFGIRELQTIQPRCCFVDLKKNRFGRFSSPERFPRAAVDPERAGDGPSEPGMA